MSRPRVLLVEDEYMIARSLQRLLRDVEVVYAADGVAALQVLEETSVVCVLCDLRMPGMSGDVFWRELLVRDPDLAERFAFCTADHDGIPEDFQGPVVTKPWDLASIRSVLATWLPKPGEG